MGLLDRAREWSNRKLREESAEVKYLRGEKEIATILMRISPPVNVIGPNTVIALARDERDFLVNREDLVDYEGNSFLPEIEDKIIQTVGGVEKTFVIPSADANDQNHFAYRDGNETSIRIHALLYGE